MSELLTKPQTMADVYRLLPEGTPVQLINDKFYMSPAPNIPHFEIIDSIVFELKKTVKEKDAGRVFYAPVDVFLGKRNAVQPDIFYISKDNFHVIMEDAIYGVPDIVVEVLSGNKSFDLKKKKAVYEEFGVKEYFIVNPADKSVISYYLENQKYVEQISEKSKFKSELLKAEINF